MGAFQKIRMVQLRISGLGGGLDVLIKDDGVLSALRYGSQSVRHSSTFRGRRPDAGINRGRDTPPNCGVEGFTLALSVGLPRRLKSDVMPFAYAHRPSSFEVN